jgi:1-phosphofructokinase family hexose kinase
MIYTITLNPTLDITYVLERIEFGEAVRAKEVIKTPGGKGINVSRALRSMGVESVAMGMMGGYAGEEAINLLQQEGLILQIVRIKNETRTNVIVIGDQDDRELMIRAEGPVVDTRETERLTDFFFRLSGAPDAVVLSGSLPRGVPEDVYYSIIEKGKARGAIVVLDASGEPFKQGIEAGPSLIKPNREELEELAGEKLETEDDVIAFCRKLLNKGIMMIAVSLGEDGALLVTADYVLKGKVPKQEGDTVGAGDSMVAGLLIGLIEDKPIEETFRMGLACGVSAVANHGPGLCEPVSFEKLLPGVRVERLR